MAARTQVSLTFIKMFALILIIIPGIMALANGKNHKLLYQYITVFRRWNGFKLNLFILFE